MSFSSTRYGRKLEYIDEIDYLQPRPECRLHHGGVPYGNAVLFFLMGLKQLPLIAARLTAADISADGIIQAILADRVTIAKTAHR